MNNLQQSIEAQRPRAEALCTALRRKAEALFGRDILTDCNPDGAAYRLERDPASGADGLVGEWLDAHGYRVGMLIFHGDGSCFGEFDVVRAHPRDERWFVEAVEAWAGRPDGEVSDGEACDGKAADEIRVDLRLLAAL